MLAKSHSKGVQSLVFTLGGGTFPLEYAANSLAFFHPNLVTGQNKQYRDALIACALVILFPRIPKS